MRKDVEISHFHSHNAQKNVDLIGEKVEKHDFSSVFLKYPYIVIILTGF